MPFPALWGKILQNSERLENDKYICLNLQFAYEISRVLL